MARISKYFITTTMSSQLNFRWEEERAVTKFWFRTANIPLTAGCINLWGRSHCEEVGTEGQKEGRKGVTFCFELNCIIRPWGGLLPSSLNRAMGIVRAFSDYETSVALVFEI